MKVTTIVGLLLHIIVLVVATIVCGSFLEMVNITSDLTEVAFKGKYTAAIRNGVILSALIFLFWQFAGRFFYINNIWNSKFNMRRNWYILWSLVIMLQFIFYTFLKDNYAQNGFYGFLSTVFIFMIPSFAFWIATAAASPSLFKYAAPWSRFVRPILDRIFNKGASRR